MSAYERSTIRIVLMGHNGCGKTTMINSLLSHSGCRFVSHDKSHALTQMHMDYYREGVKVILWEPLRIMAVDDFLDSVLECEGNNAPDVVLVCAARNTLLTSPMTYEKWVNISKAAFPRTPVMLLSTYTNLNEEEKYVPRFWETSRDILYAKTFGADSHKEINIYNSQITYEAVLNAINLGIKEVKEDKN